MRYDRNNTLLAPPWGRYASRSFWDFVDKESEAPCWVWTNGRYPGGYGRWFHGPTHRVSLEAHHGPIPPGMFALHHCDNPPCVNPDHLYAGTNRDNVRDTVVRGRHRTQQRRYDIADDIAARIQRGEYKPGDKIPSIGQLVQQYSVAPSTACQAMRLLVKRGLTWGRAGIGTFVR